MITLSDRFEPTLWPLLHLKPLFAYGKGIFSEIERALKKGEQQFEIITAPTRDQKFYIDYFKEINIHTDLKFIEEGRATVKPNDLLKGLGDEIANDIDLLNKEEYGAAIKCQTTGAKKDIFIHRDAQINAAAYIDSSDGPVVIDAGCTVSPFSWLRGPLYIGKDTAVDKANIQNCRIGNTCRLGGEIADSIVGSFTNKHHEGFLGHSLAGDWVNLGALTTTSDLKNNYGQISLDYEGVLYAAGTIKFGSIIGDFCKTAIGTMLNTGTIIDLGCLLFDGFNKRKYFAPFFWGGPGDLYKWAKFEADIAKVMGRRKQNPSQFQLQRLQMVYSRYLRA